MDNSYKGIYKGFYKVNTKQRKQKTKKPKSRELKDPYRVPPEGGEQIALTGTPQGRQAPLKNALGRVFSPSEGERAVPPLKTALRVRFARLTPIAKSGLQKKDRKSWLTATHLQTKGEKKMRTREIPGKGEKFLRIRPYLLNTIKIVNW